VSGGLGFNVAKGTAIRTLEPMSEKAVRDMDRALAEQSRRLHDRLLKPAFPTPSLFALVMFRMARTSVKRNVPEDRPDYVYYRDRGWFEADYYYPTRLGPLKKAVGALLDWAFARMPTFEVADRAQQAD